MNYGQVRYAASLATADSTDAGPEPDIVPLTGYVDFVPSIQVTYSDDLGRQLFLGTVTAGLDANGVLRDAEGNDTVTLIASDSPELSRQSWTYEAYIRLNGLDPVGPYPFALESGDVVDLGMQAPLIISQGIVILRGPAGPEGPQGPPGEAGGTIDSVNGQTGVVTLDAADVGVTNATTTTPGLVQIGGAGKDVQGTATDLTVPLRVYPLFNVDNSDPVRPNTQATVLYVTPTTDQPALNGTKSGGTYALAHLDLLAVYTP